MALFGKKEEATQSDPSDSLVDLINYMKNQGYSEDQIVEYLQREGYKSSQIFDSLSQASLKSETKKPISGREGQSEMPQEPTSMPPIEAPKPMARQKPAPQKQESIQRIEELAEAIIEEKWAALIKNVEKIAAWKERTESKVIKLEEQFNNLQMNFDKLHTAILGKISEYSQSMEEVGTDVKAMNEVFKKILPTFTENVAELSKVTKAIKKKK